MSLDNLRRLANHVLQRTGYKLLVVVRAAFQASSTIGRKAWAPTALAEDEAVDLKAPTQVNSQSPLRAVRVNCEYPSVEASSREGSLSPLSRTPQ
jgi:hypothetical protein